MRRFNSSKVQDHTGLFEPEINGTYALREPGEAYRTNFDTQNESLRPENTLPWERIAEVPAI
jgi:hypothetical protein